MKCETRIDKAKSTLTLIIVMLFLGMLVNLIAAILNGLRADWFRFGLFLTVSVMFNIYFVGVLLARKLNMLSDKFTNSETSVG